jgi:hypothetical protein
MEMSDNTDVVSTEVRHTLLSEGLGKRADLAERRNPGVDHAFRLEDIIHVFADHSGELVQAHVVFSARDRYGYRIIQSGDVLEGVSRQWFFKPLDAKRFQFSRGLQGTRIVPANTWLPICG